MNNMALDKMGYQGPVVQSIVSLRSLLMTNLLTVVAKVFSNTLIFLLQKMQKLLKFFQQKKSMYLPYFKIEILSFEQLGTGKYFSDFSMKTYVVGTH